MEKTFISAQDLLETSFDLAAMVFESGYRPTHILGVWRGGAPIAITVHEGLLRLGNTAQPYVIQAASYGEETQSAGRVELFGLEAVSAQLACADRLLIVDDIYDTGLSMAAILEALSRHCGAALPRDIKIAAAYYKPRRNQTQRKPDYYMQETIAWMVFPHELMGCSNAEITTQKALPKRFLDALISTGV